MTLEYICICIMALFAIMFWRSNETSKKDGNFHVKPSIFCWFGVFYSFIILSYAMDKSFDVQTMAVCLSIWIWVKYIFIPIFNDLIKTNDHDAIASQKDGTSRNVIKPPKSER